MLWARGDAWGFLAAWGVHVAGESPVRAHRLPRGQPAFQAGGGMKLTSFAAEDARLGRAEVITLVGVDSLN